MSLKRWAIAPSWLLGVGLALIGSGIAVGALFLPWVYRCGITDTVCVDPGPQDPSTFTPIGSPYSPQGLPTLVMAILPIAGLFFALMLAFLPAAERRALAISVFVVGLCGVCGTLSMSMLVGLMGGPDHWDWGVAVSILGYVTLLAGIVVMLRSEAPARHANDT